MITGKSRAMNRLSSHHWIKVLTLSLLVPVSAAQAGSNFPPDAPLSADVCMTCHGGYGLGSAVVGGPKLAGMEGWYIKRQLEGFRNSFRGTDKAYIPSYEMRATAAVLTDAEINKVIADIGKWPDAAAAPTLEGNSERGAQLYGTCASCHGAVGEGNEALGAPALANRSDWYLLRQLERFSSGERGAHTDDIAGKQMRAMMTTLPDADSQRDVVAYINTLSKTN